jgi:hypothetical protein
MADPPRLRSESGSWEALLLRSAPTLEPPPSAQDEVWRRLEVASAVGAAAAAGATGIAAHLATSAGSKMVGEGIWLSVLKWGAVVAIGVPAVGVTARVVMHRETHETRAVVQAAAPSPAVEPAHARAAGGSLPDSSQTSSPIERPVVDLPKPGSPQRAGHTAGHAESAMSDAPSALRAESLLLGVARAKLAAGDSRGALDDVARLGVQFPHGTLVQEREVLAIDCLSAMGNRPGMRTRARAFLERFPSSPYSAHLRQLLEP